MTRLDRTSMADSPDTDRFIHLETKIAYQDKTIAELDDVVTALNRNVEELSRRVATLERQLEQVAGPGDVALTRDPADEKPPHY